MIYPSDTLYPGNTDAYPAWYMATGWSQTVDDDIWAGSTDTSWQHTTEDSWEQH